MGALHDYVAVGDEAVSRSDDFTRALKRQGDEAQITNAKLKTLQDAQQQQRDDELRDL